MINVGVLGCGKAGQMHLHWYAQHPDCRVAGVYDPQRERAQACAERFGGTVYDSWQALAAQPDIDLLSLCGPESARAEQAVYASDHHKNVLCEKPFANRLTECDQMIEEAARNNVLLFAFFNMRFHPVVEAIDEALASIGPIYACRVSYTQFRTTLNWRHKLDQAGGVLKSQGVHPIDLATHWIGPVRTVSGEMSIVHPQREVEDFALVMLRFQNGAIGEIYTCYTDRGDEAMIGELHGMTGKLWFTLSPYKPELNRVQRYAKGQSQAIPLREPDTIDPVYPGLMDCSRRTIDHVVACVKAGTPSPLNGELGRESIEIVLAAYESQRLGAKVDLPLERFESDAMQACFPRFDSLEHDLVD